MLASGEIFNASVGFSEVQSDLFHIGGINYRSTRGAVVATFGQPDYIMGSVIGLTIYSYHIDDFKSMDFYINRDREDHISRDTDSIRALFVSDPRHLWD